RRAGAQRFVGKGRDFFFERIDGGHAWPVVPEPPVIGGTEELAGEGAKCCHQSIPTTCRRRQAGRREIDNAQPSRTDRRQGEKPPSGLRKASVLLTPSLQTDKRGPNPCQRHAR